MARYVQFEHATAARGRDSDGYNPQIPMTLPAWLGGSA
jgi:hypothetical protein